MKTQISRYNQFFAKNNYSGVYQQQGRMLTDADWNESVDILKQLVREALYDTVASGAPRVGGLDIQVDGGKVKIVPGELIVDGVHAQIHNIASGLMDLQEQPDLPGYPSLDASAHSIIYADVWERPILSLEEALLLDPGLYGADTCTRSQVLLQVKYANADDTAVTDAFKYPYPTENTINPRIGNASFELDLRSGAHAPDPCDPCEREVAYEAASGNYLFRLEVHRHTINADNSRVLVLKWSSENGAEHYRLYEDDKSAIEVPAAFKRGNWIYEFFNPETERHLGIHLASGFTPNIRDLAESYAIPGAVSDDSNPNKTQEKVRRWDGYCEIAFDTSGVPSVTKGIDRGITGTQFDISIDTDSEGNSKLSMQLDTLVLGLQLATFAGGSHTPRDFISGDFWMALVRENSEQKVRVLSRQPLGVVHHYLKLAEIDSGSMVKPSNAELRRLSFPALTDLRADRVRYDIDPGSAVEQRWNDIYVGDDETGESKYPETVQQAIDDLVLGLESSDIRYPMQDCTATDYETPVPSFNRYLLDIIDPSGTHPPYPEVKLKDLWDAVLCKLDAAMIPYDVAKAKTYWENFLNSGANKPKTVQDAIDSILENLESSDISYEIPDCNNSPDPSFATELGFVSGETEQLNTILEKILCDGSAATLPLDKTTVGGLSPLLDLSKIVTTQDALNYLADKISGRGCASTVGPSGDYETLEAAFNNLSGSSSQSINLCLLPGVVHTLDNPVTLTNKQAIRLTGSGRGACRVEFKQPVMLDAGTVSMENLQWHSDDRRASLVMTGVNVDVQHCGFERIRQYNPHLWSSYFAGAVDLVILSTAIDSKNNLIITGMFHGQATIGGKEYASTHDNIDAFVMKSNPAGVPVWFVPFTSGLNPYLVSGIAVDKEDNIWLAGPYNQTITIVDKTLTSTSKSYDNYLAKFSAEGKFITAVSIGGGAPQQTNDLGKSIYLAIDSNNSVWITSMFSAPMTVGKDTLTPNNNLDIFVAHFDQAGEALHAYSILAKGSPLVTSLIVDGKDDVWIGGKFTGTLTIGKKTLSSTLGSTGAPTEDAFIAKFTTAGEPGPSASFGGATGSDVCNALAVDSKNNLWVAGSFDKDMTVENTTLSSQAGNQDVFLAKFAADGTYITATSFGGTSNDLLNSMVVDGKDTVWLTGGFSQTITIGGKKHEATGSTQDIYLGQFGQDGQALTSTTVAGQGDESMPNLVVDAENNLWLSGDFRGTLIIDGKTVADSGASEDTSTGSAATSKARAAASNQQSTFRDAFNAFSVKLSNAGQYLTHAVIQGRVSGEAAISDISTDGDGNTWVCGMYVGSIMIGTTRLDSAPGSNGIHSVDNFVAKFDGKGKAVLAFSIGSSGNLDRCRIAHAPDDTLWMCGSFASDVTIGEITLTTKSSAAIYLARFKTDGTLIDKPISYESTAGAALQDIAVDSAASLWVCGSYSGELKLGSFDLKSTQSSTGSDTTDAYLFKIDKTISPTAAKSFGSVYYDVSQSLAVDRHDNVIVCGQFAGTMTVDKTKLTSTKSSTGADSTDTFVIKFNSSANLVKAISFGGPDYVSPQSMAVDSQDNTWINGFFSQTISIGKTNLTAASNARDCYLAKFDGALEALAATSFSGTNVGSIDAMALDSKDTAWLVGNYTGSLTIGDASLSSTNNTVDFFLASFDQQANAMYAKSYGGNGMDTGSSVALDKEGNIVIAGFINQDITLAGDKVGTVFGYSGFVSKFVNPQPDHPLIMIDSTHADAAANFSDNTSVEAVDIEGIRHYLDALVVGKGIGGQVHDNKIRGNLLVQGQSLLLYRLLGNLKLTLPTLPGLPGGGGVDLPGPGKVPVPDSLRRGLDLSIANNVMERIFAPIRRMSVSMYRGNIIQEKGSYISADMLTFSENAFPAAYTEEVIARVDANNLIASGNQAPNAKVQIEVHAINSALGTSLLQYLQ